MALLLARQVSEHYKAAGRRVTQQDTQFCGWNKVYKDIAAGLCSDICISFGWNSAGLGKSRGFSIIEILLLCHGGVRNDTICVVEKKLDKMVSCGIKEA